MNPRPTTDPDEWIESAARNHPQRAFLKTAAGREISYGSLREQSARFASALRQRGVRAGDRVAAQVEKSPEAVLLYVACLRIGAVFVPINTANTPHELEYFLRDSQPHVAIVRPPDLPMLAPLARRAGVVHVETLGEEGEGSLPGLVGESPGERRCRSACRELAGRHRLHLRHHWPLERGGADARESRDRMQPRSSRRGALPAAMSCCTRCRCSTCTASSPRSIPFSLPPRACCCCRSSTRHRYCVTCRRSVSTWVCRLITPASCSKTALNRREYRARALVHFGIRAAAHRDASGILSAHRPHHSRALWHDRDPDEHLESVRGSARAGLGGATSAGNRDPRGSPRFRRQRRGGDRPARGQGAERVCRLLARCREDAWRIHGRRLVQDGRSRPDR